jgi:hypothetical protein
MKIDEEMIEVAIAAGIGVLLMWLGLMVLRYVGLV